MSYEQTTWVNGSTPALDAVHLNKMETGIANAISRSGDTMTGALNLYGAPTSDNEAATKKYVDENIMYISGTYNFIRGSTTVIGKIPNYNSTRHKVLVSTIEMTFTEGYFAPSFIELTENGVKLDKYPGPPKFQIIAYIDKSGYISIYEGSEAQSSANLTFLVIPVKTVALIN